MNAKIRMIGLLVAVVVVVAAIGLSESRGQDAAVDLTKVRNAVAQEHSDSSLQGQRADLFEEYGRFGRGFGPIPITQQIKNHRHYLSDPNKSDEEKAKAKQELQVLLNQYFDEDIKARQTKITEIEQRVAKLKAQLEKRRAAKSELVQLQMKLIENEAAGLGFFGTSEEGDSQFNVFSPRREERVLSPFRRENGQRLQQLSR